MTKKQPFLPGFPTTICGRIRRRLQDVIAARRKALLGSSIASYALQFSHILPADFLDEQSASQRRRHYCNTNIFWAWLAQILEANASCSKGVSLVQAWCADANLPAPAGDTGAYCKARKRIGVGFLRALRGRVTAHLGARIRPEDKYEGLDVKSIDGSSAQLEDTAENQACYPQPASQKPGCGFPVMGVMGVLNHSHGGWEDFATCTESAHDAPVAHKLLHNFGAGDLACADRAFCTYEFISLLLGQGAHSLMRLHQARHRVLDFRRGRKIGKNQRLVTWTKPSKQPAKSPPQRSRMGGAAGDLRDPPHQVRIQGSRGKKTPHGTRDDPARRRALRLGRARRDLRATLGHRVEAARCQDDPRHGEVQGEDTGDGTQNTGDDDSGLQPGEGDQSGSRAGGGRRPQAGELQRGAGYDRGTHDPLPGEAATA